MSKKSRGGSADGADKLVPTSARPGFLVRMGLKVYLNKFSKENPEMIDKIFYLLKGVATKAGLLASFLGVFAAFLTEAGASFPQDGDKFTVLMWVWETVAKLGAAIGGFGGLRKLIVWFEGKAEKS